MSWLSKLQPTVALSTAEAETNAAVEAVKSIVHTRLLMRELGRGPSGPTELYEDNAPAIAMVDARYGRRGRQSQSTQAFSAQGALVEGSKDSASLQVHQS